MPKYLVAVLAAIIRGTRAALEYLRGSLEQKSSVMQGEQ